MAATHDSHPSIAVLKEFALGHNLDDAKADAVLKHIDTCSACLDTSNDATRKGRGVR